jgi:hypothetical protein
MGETKNKLLGLFRSRSTAPPSSKSSSDRVDPSVLHHGVGGLMRSRRENAGTAENDRPLQTLLEAIEDVHTAQDHTMRDLSPDGRPKFLYLYGKALHRHSL